MRTSIEGRADFDFVRYANCWEDAWILSEALSPARGKTFLSIGSGGDNSFSLLAAGARVIAVDLNPAQMACIDIKRAAIQELAYDEVLGFFGITPSAHRTETFSKLEGSLSAGAASFWRCNLPVVANGLIHGGKFERYFHKFRTCILSRIHSSRSVETMLEEKSEGERETFYAETWNNLRWRILFRVFFSRFIMGRLGRDPEFFRYVEGSVSDRILARTRYALTALPTHDNPYLEYILAGNFDRALPHYLRPENYERIRDNLDHLVLFQGAVQDAALEFGVEGFDGYNLSDIFEYLDPSLCEEVYRRLLQHAKPGARFAYWNMLVPRSCPSSLADKVRCLDDLAGQLFERDLAWFYSAFRVEEVI